MTVPGKTLVFAAALLAVLMIGVVAAPVLGAAVLLGDALLVAACVLQGRRLGRQRIVVEVEEPRRMQIDRETSRVFRVSNAGPHRVFVAIRQPWPEGFEAPREAIEVAVGPGEVVRVELKATPHRRGRIEMPAPEVQVRFAMALGVRRWSLEDQALTIYPNLQAVGEFDTLRRSRALTQLGVHRVRTLGAGREFEQMRYYLPDDEYRDVNWKATARHRRPITNVYRTERSQDMMICVDCGRMMGDAVGRGSALDHAVDAAVMLAHAGAWQGDRTGLLLFGDTVKRFLPPRAGALATRRLMDELVHAHPEPVFPSYAAMASALRTGQRRRAMVFLFTDLNDPQLAADLAQVLPLLSRRHLLVVVSLRDPLLEAVASGPADDAQQVSRVLAARKLALDRAEHARKLAQIGVSVLEADAGSLTMSVINRYLEIKSRQLV